MKDRKWHLSFETPLHSRPMQLEDGVLSLGSCFSQRIGEQLKEWHLPIELNPFGISFDALSLSRQLNILNGEKLPEDHFEHLGLWRHFDSHGSLSHSNLSYHKSILDQQIHSGRKAFKEKRWLIITLGTAFYFQLKESNRNVANCHKLSGQLFERKLADIDEMLEALLPVLNSFLNQNEDREILLSVSPVRHIRDGLVANNRSKARLIEVCQQLTEQSGRINYFPSYEWWIDVWRDHRVYADDLVHPSDQSVRWILDEFIQSQCDSDMQVALKEIKAYKDLESHRSLHSSSIENNDHLKKVEQIRRQIQTKYPRLIW